MNRPPEMQVVMTLTDELFLPSRVIYRVFDKPRLESRIKSLRCMQWEDAGPRWTWLYQHEARRVGFPTAYHAVPEERQPIILATCYPVKPDVLHVYLHSTERLIRWLAFFDEHVPRTCAKGEYLDEYNRVTAVAGLVAPPKPEDLFRDETRIQFTDSAEALRKAASFREYLAQLQDKTLAELERHRMDSFYEDGIEQFEHAMNLRKILAMSQHVTSQPIRPHELIQNALSATLEKPEEEEGCRDRKELNELIGLGYEHLEAKKPKEACEVWIEAWRLLLQIAEEAELRTFDQVDQVVLGIHWVFDWIHDFETEMSNVGLEDLSWQRHRLQVCQEVLNRFQMDLSSAGLFRRGMAECWTALGDRAKSDALYEGWLREDPQWAWGWIGWSDLYSIRAINAEEDPARAEELLKRGLAVPDVDCPEYILDRLASLYESEGRKAEAREIREQLVKMVKLRIPPPLEKPRPVIRAEKVGRNDPCPCGSGRKYKKCCGR